MLLYNNNNNNNNNNNKCTYINYRNDGRFNGYF